jgi:hypothetical protein
VGERIDRRRHGAIGAQLPAAPLVLRARTKFELITFGPESRYSTLCMDKTADLIEADDLERFDGSAIDASVGALT